MQLLDQLVGVTASAVGVRGVTNGPRGRGRSAHARSVTTSHCS